MTRLAKSKDLPDPDGQDCAAVACGMDLAALLVRASPGRARSFAVAMHERACAAGDEVAVALWSDALALLPRTAPQPQPGAPCA